MNAETGEGELGIDSDGAVDVVRGGDEASIGAKRKLCNACDVVGDGDCGRFECVEDGHVFKGSWGEGIVTGDVCLQIGGEHGNERFGSGDECEGSHGRKDGMDEVKARGGR